MQWLSRTFVALVFAVAAVPACGADGPPESILREVRSPASLPSGRYVAFAQWQAARGALHQAGRAVADSAAPSQRAWEARLGVDRAGVQLLYGPYLDAPAGDYVAFIRLKLLDEAGEDRVADLDAVVGYGQTTCAVLRVTGTDLTQGKYVCVPLPFRCPGGKLECRVLWRGVAGLRADRIEVFRLEGGSIGPTTEPRVADAVPSGEPRNMRAIEEPRKYPDPFPRSARPARTLLVCDILRQPPDVQLCVVTLQGLVNRQKPRIYCLFNDSDATWLNWMRRNKWISDTKAVADWKALLKQFRPTVRGAVITDPSLPATKNIANMVASVENGVVVSPRLQKALALPVLADLRGRWKTSAEAYRWALDTLWPRLNHRLAACSYPDHLGLRDYLTQHRAFIFWVSGAIDGAKPYSNPNAEVRVAEEMLARMPPNSPIMSYPWEAKDVGMGEGPGVTLFAEFGKFLVGSINASNLSVHSGIGPARLTQRAVRPPKLDPAKVYYSFIMSDGDNLPVLTISNFPQLWSDPLRGKVPMGWTLTPAACLLMPDVVSYYYSTATPADAFVGGVSGFGYTYPDSYALRYRDEDRQQVYDGFLDLTAEYMRRSDLKSVWIMNATDPARIRRYADRIPELEALFPDYGRRVADYGEATYPIRRNVGVFHAVTGWTEQASRRQRVAEMVEQIRAITPSERPAFMHAFIWNWGAQMSVYKEVMKQLGPGYVAVRPDHLAALYRQDLTRREVIVRAPALVAAIEGQAMQCTFTLQNVVDREMAVTLQVTNGLSSAVVEPPSVSLPPGGSAEVSVSGVPTADRVTLALAGSFGERSLSLNPLRIASHEVVGAGPATDRLALVRHYEGEALAHRSGRAVADSGAVGLKSWLAESGVAEPGFVAFGPYAALQKGRYVALFRVKRTGPATGPIAVLDTCTGGGRTQTGKREITAHDLPDGEYRVVAVPFDHPGAEIETRVLWSGRPNLYLDWISIWRTR